MKARLRLHPDGVLMPRGRGQPDRRQQGNKATRQYAASAPEEEKPFDELLVTKAYTKEQSKAKVVKFGGFGLGLDFDQIDALSIWSSDDELDKASVDLNEPPALEVGRRAARRGRGCRRRRRRRRR